MFLSAVVVLSAIQAAAASVTSAPPQSTVNPPPSQISDVAATATALSPTSNVKGAAFDRFIQIWLENTDYSAASGDNNQKFLASQGITLSNYWSITHPSEPNYLASVAGDNFGGDGDDFWALPSNVSSVVDLLDSKGISWGAYQEHIPYPGFQGYNYSNQKTFANDYVRKHNPLILLDSVSKNQTRLQLIKGFDAWNNDIDKKTLPQWAFVTPNMTNDGHDTNITFASAWERNFVSNFLNNSYFMDNTLVLLTFDESETYPKQNKIFSVLLGGAIPSSLKGTTDNTFYTHYSTISSVSANWGLPSLGRWDCAANVFQIVANQTKYVNYQVDTTNLYLNSTYPGPLSDTQYTPVWPNPDINAKCASGQGVLSSVVNAFANTKPTFNYSSSPFPIDSVANVNTGGSATKPNSSGSLSATKTGSAAATSSGAVSGLTVTTGSGLGALVLAGIMAFM